MLVARIFFYISLVIFDFLIINKVIIAVGMLNYLHVYVFAFLYMKIEI